jgi:hypothetical protein
LLIVAVCCRLPFAVCCRLPFVAVCRLLPFAVCCRLPFAVCRLLPFAVCCRLPFVARVCLIGWGSSITVAVRLKSCGKVKERRINLKIKRIEGQKFENFL